jgi:hypothetical protein
MKLRPAIIAVLATGALLAAVIYWGRHHIGSRVILAVLLAVFAFAVYLIGSAVEMLVHGEGPSERRGFPVLPPKDSEGRE